MTYKLYNKYLKYQWKMDFKGLTINEKNDRIYNDYKSHFAFIQK